LVAAIKLLFDHQQFLKTVSSEPGIYQMFDKTDRILYVGKAKNLKNRLSSYFRKSGLSIKTEALVAKIANIQVTITESESAALILEQSLIKALKPPYNVLLRDDKSYPYIFISDGDYPRVSMHRGAKRRKGQYFGPYPSAGAVYRTLNFLQKTFRIRPCDESVFQNRNRPCLQYQIDRCTAPCVNYISEESYQKDIHHSILFLQGKSEELMATLADRMERVSERLDFEAAALLRDQISGLRRIQSEYGIEAKNNNIDIFAIQKKSGWVCVHIMYLRDGRIIGSKSYFDENKLEVESALFLLAFMEQFYLASGDREIPREIIVNQTLPAENQQLFLDVLSNKAGRKVSLTHKVKAQRYKWLALASTAAEQNLQQKLASKANLYQRFLSLQELLELDETPQRLECFDVSHSSGELTVASCVVFNQTGPLKSDYRRFNIEDIQPGDDYAAMEQLLRRRYTRIQQEEGKLPDVQIVDGGKGQLNKARAVMAELGIQQVYLMGIAKGTTRKAGFETLILEDGREISLSSDLPGLHLLQEIRDEAHRFAITGHKQRRDKKRRTSSLGSIPNVGSKRSRQLLRHFGGLQEIQRASLDDLARVPGISKKIAENIYSAFRND
jgi:excinuclease ABC subunit C